MSRRMLSFSMVLVTLLFCALVSVTASAITSSAPNITESVDESETNYNCPEDCYCTLAHNTNKPFLHAKCKSLNGLKSNEPLQVSLPIHSIDLSYLSLQRLSHLLEKLHGLASIDLSHNELHEIGHLGRRIKKLNLKHNRITSAKLMKLPQHVQVLNLQNNDITFLPLEFTRLSNLQSLELSHNKINCSCETLDVRNWLQERHVFMEHAIVCSYPAETAGQSWLQVKQSDICEKEKRGAYVNVEENEVMLGDQPIEASGDNVDEEEEEELGKAFMPFDKRPGKSNEHSPADDVEGSGDLSVMNMPMGLGETSLGPDMFRMFAEQVTTRTSAKTDSLAGAEEDELDEADEDGSGSGGNMLIIPHFEHEPIVTEDFDEAYTKISIANYADHDDDFDNKPMEHPLLEESPSPDIFKDNMGIFEGNESEKPVKEEVIVPIVHHDLDSDKLPDVVTDGPSEDSETIQRANVGKKDDSNATYFLLGVIALIVIGLMLFVGIKRCKNSRNAERDAEAQRQTELLDMDKKNVGKPIKRNGNEYAPLIGEKSKVDQAKPISGSGKKPYDSSDVKDGSGQQPLFNGNGNSNGNAKDSAEASPPKTQEPNEAVPHQYYPITPRYPTPQSPRASKYAQHAQTGTEQNNNNPENSYLPASPKLGRYSPVYSPETGRVKIKLTETPKPKTPMLVTRSKSNAGEFITTPVRNGTDTYLDAPPVVHQTVGGANGHVHN